jgi:hypothetical protein
MDAERFPKLMSELYAIVGELETMFGRHFTPDGHMVGSLGEGLAAHFYGLELTPPSTPGCDAYKNGRAIEIKATQAKRVSFRCEPPALLVLRLEKDGSFEEVYNGDGSRVWAKLKDKPLPSNGQYQMGLATLRKLNREVAQSERIDRVQRPVS